MSFSLIFYAHGQAHSVIPYLSSPFPSFILEICIISASAWLEATISNMERILCNMPPFGNFDLPQLRRSAYAIVRLHHPNYFENVPEEDFLSSCSEDDWDSPD